MTQNALICWYRARRNLSGASQTLGNAMWLTRVQGLDITAFPPASPKQLATTHGITNGEWMRQLLYGHDEDRAAAEDRDAVAKALDEWYAARREFTKARYQLNGILWRLTIGRYEFLQVWESTLRQVHSWRPVTLVAVATAVAADRTEGNRLVRRGKRVLHVSAS